VVVDRELIVRVWNRQAEDLWGLREQEAVGQHLLNLDSGLPTERLKSDVKDVIGGTSDGAEQEFEAVNRRGRTVALRTHVTPLLSGGAEPSGALLLIEHLGG
jgi:two-component system CheB/CheR fusion protein